MRCGRVGGLPVGSLRLGGVGGWRRNNSVSGPRLILVLEMLYGLSSLTLISAAPALPSSTQPNLAATVSLARSRPRLSLHGIF